MKPSRYPILTFTLVGAILIFANDALIRTLMNMTRSPHAHRAMLLAEAISWLGPGIWLVMVAFCLLLTTGAVTPPWNRGRWIFAIGALYLFHLPLVLFHIPLILFPPLAILGRWGFTAYLFLGSMGVVCALWLLMGRLHVAAVLLLLAPIVRDVSWKYMPHGTRSAEMTLFAIFCFPLIGWWVRDAATRCKRQPASANASQDVTLALDGGV